MPLLTTIVVLVFYYSWGFHVPKTKIVNGTKEVFFSESASVINFNYILEQSLDHQSILEVVCFSSIIPTSRKKTVKSKQGKIKRPGQRDKNIFWAIYFRLGWICSVLIFSVGVKKTGFYLLTRHLSNESKMYM